jgi:hypothetical protein
MPVVIVLSIDYPRTGFLQTSFLNHSDMPVVIVLSIDYPRTGFPNLPPAKLALLFAGRPPLIAHVHGHDYVRFALRFDEHASLIWAIGGERPRNPGLVSLVAMGLLVGLAGFLIRRRPGAFTDPLDDLAWWALALDGVLLTAPLTWSMNSVWLLPSVFVILARAHRNRGMPHVLPATALALLGLVLVAVPDRFGMAWPAALHALSPHKYIVGEIAVILGLFATWPKQKADPTDLPPTAGLTRGRAIPATRAKQPYLALP